MAENPCKPRIEKYSVHLDDNYMKCGDDSIIFGEMVEDGKLFSCLKESIPDIKISNRKSYSIRACFEKGVFYNGQFTAIC